MKDLEKIVVDSSLIERNKYVYKQRLNNARLAFDSKIKTGMRQRILPAEGELTIDAIETFWSAYGSIKGAVANKAKGMGDFRFVEFYSLFVAASYADDKFSTQIDSPLKYMSLPKIDIPSEESLLIDSIMTNFINTTNSCNTGKILAKTTRGFFNRIQELAGEQLNNKYRTQLENFERKYKIVLEEKFTAQGTNVESYDPDEGKPNEMITFDDIGGYKNIVEEMKFLVKALTAPEYIQDLAYPAPKGILFYGLPGTGKTLLAKAIACESGLPFHYLNVAEILSKWVGESEKNLRNKLTRSGIHFLDEADSILGESTGGISSDHYRTLCNIYAESIDGFKSRKDAVYILATNTLKLTKKARRAGRLDEIYYFGLPEPEAIYHILQIHAKKLSEKAKKPIMNGLDYTAITTAVYTRSVAANAKNPNVGMVPADCENILKMTHRRMLKNYWKSGEQEFIPMTTVDVIETVTSYNLEARA